MAQTRKQERRNQQAEAQARNATARAAAAKAARRRKAIMTALAAGGGVAVVAAIAVPLATGAFSGDDLPDVRVEGRTTPPPWPAPAHPLGAAKEVGLRVSAMEGAELHFHSHLDILVDGKKVAVPGNIGIDTEQGQLSELHTHDERGVIHVEAPDKGHRYVLGQLFAEWDVRLDETHIGGLTAEDGKTLRAYVGGKQVDGDPADIELKPHQEIALVFGAADAKVDVPKSYRFQEGE